MFKNAVDIGFGRKFWHSMGPVSHAARSPAFKALYAIFALFILSTTTLLWATLGARLQGRNADQLSDPYLFSTLKTLHGASFPSTHTFLLKWPIFWLINLFGVDRHNLVFATVGVVMVTVATLVLVLYKIERRPLVFGTVCLGLSLALLLIPAQPYAGGFLPVNMAMLTTRNIEYAVYLVSLLMFARATRMRDRNFIVGVLLLAVLIASDKLFMSLSLGGALIALVVYAALRAWNLVTFALRWFIGGGIATVSALCLLASISALHITNFANAGETSPYALVTTAHGAVLGFLYGVLGLFTNAGANPAFDNQIVRELPSDLLHHLVSFSGPAYIVAAFGLLYAGMLAWRMAWSMPKMKPRTAPPIATLLALALIWSTVAAFGVFVATQHDYQVDARYLTISLFALAVTVAVELRKHRWNHPEVFLVIAAGMLVAIVLAVGTSVHVSNMQTSGLKNVINRNHVIADALRRHGVDVLVGSYWRVLPVKLVMGGNITTTPLASCTQPVSTLTSTAWEPNLRSRSFAYLLTITGSVADFPNCSLSTVVSAYGRPNATQVIAGTVANPAEVLLFYDNGSHAPVPATEKSTPVSILPTSLSSLNGNDDCNQPTVMNIVAHEDDDLLFMNPDLQHEVSGGDCVRTIFMTAGNAGKGKLYWLSRQLGSEAAYDNMLGKKHVWVQQTIQLTTNEYFTVASPRDDSNVSLIFLNLPDGNLNGQGFPMSNFESLAKLKAGGIASVQSVDEESSYTAPQLVAALTQFMQLYRPSVIQTQADATGGPDPDHSDHIATSQFAQAAAAMYSQREFLGAVNVPVKRYLGYPMQRFASNVSGADLEQKQATFFAYGHFDSVVCNSVANCRNTAYALYLTRQYQEQ